jgi:hypothetical protein
MDDFKNIAFYIGAVLGPILGWFMGRRQRAVATTTGELENESMALDLYQKAIVLLEAARSELESCRLERAADRVRLQDLERGHTELKEKLTEAGK